MSLVETLADETKKPTVISDCCTLIDQEVGDKGGISGLAIKAGYGAVKGVKPGFITEVVRKLLPEFAVQLDPIWAEAKKAPKPEEKFAENRARVADALLVVTDAKIGEAKSGVVRSTYGKLRGSAKKNVEEAVPRLAKLLAKHAG